MKSAVFAWGERADHSTIFMLHTIIGTALGLYGCKSVLMVKLEGLHVVTGAFEEWAKEKGNDLGRIYCNDIKTRKYVK